MSKDCSSKYFYKKNGYAVIPRLICQSKIENLRFVVFQTYLKLVSNRQSFSSVEPWNTPDFDECLINLRNNFPERFSALYDTVQTNNYLIKTVLDDKILNASANFLETERHSISTSGHYLRMDVPKDMRNALQWHQDRAFYEQNKDGNNGLVATIALQDITENNGALVVCPGSQNAGFIEPVKTDKSHYTTSQQLVVSQKEVEKYEEHSVNLGAGDVLFLNMNLFHKSGYNRSSGIRFSALARFHNAATDDFVPFGVDYYYNKIH